MTKKKLSVAKRARQSEKKRIRNHQWKTMVKTYIKKVESAIASKDTEGTQHTLQEAIKVISKASSKGIFHKKTASRKISSLTKKVNRSFKSEAA